MSLTSLKIATRKSPLALWQAEYVASALKAKDPSLAVELLPLITSGDKFLQTALDERGGKGLFVKELEAALLEKKADLAVHSMKDLPATMPQGLILESICKRGNPYDALVASSTLTLATLPAGASIGTASLRRQAQILALRPDLCVKLLRGNVQTRLGKLKEGHYDALILAQAGLERLGLQSWIKEDLSTALLPACGQGALGIQCREDDLKLRDYLSALNDPLSELCIKTERAVSAGLEGSCRAPLAVFCTPNENKSLSLTCRVLSPDGKESLLDQQIGPQAEAHQLAEACIEALLKKGAQRLLSYGQ